MAFRSRLARPCNYLCEPITPVPVVHKQQLSTRIPQPIYPLPLPIDPVPQPPSSCPPTVVPLQVGEYPTNRVVKPGEILATMVTELPIGYLWCNGQEVSRSTYSLLFSIIGTYYGGENSEYTFNLPKLTNEINPNTRYIIKYNTYTESFGTGTGTVSEVVLNPMTELSSGGRIQVLSYPSTFSPPPGTVLYNTMNFLPDGYLSCDGSDVSRSEYSILFNTIGTIYGPGNGTTTFNLPSLSSITTPYRYIIRYDVPDNLYVSIQPNLVLDSVSLSGTTNLVMK